jgi:hypothetical protein
MLFAMYLIFWSAFWQAMTRPPYSAQIIDLAQWKLGAA